MTQRKVFGLLAVGGIIMTGLVPSSCQGGGIGDPCIPEDEYRGTFGGFQVQQENIESRSFQCESRICLVNHFQGRVSCPLGQPAKEVCTPGGSACSEGDCVESATFAPDCTADTADRCTSGTCTDNGYCACGGAEDCPEGFFCQEETQQCKLFVCHVEGNCQDGNATPDANADKDCCIPGTDQPVASEVCGQCSAEKLRDAANSVYCSCRCGVAEGEPEDENFNFCECPDGFECAEVRPDLGLGDVQLTGKYCIKAGDPLIVNEKVDTSAATSNCIDNIGFKGSTTSSCAGS